MSSSPDRGRYHGEKEEKTVQDVNHIVASVLHHQQPTPELGNKSLSSVRELQ